MLQLTKHTGETSARTSRRGVTTGKRSDDSVKHPAFKALVALNIIGACVAAYLYFNREQMPAYLQPEAVPMQQTSATLSAETPFKPINNSTRKEVGKSGVPPSTEVKQQPVAPAATVAAPAVKEPAALPAERMRTRPVPQEGKAKLTTTEPASRSSRISETVSYTVAGPQVYFHNQPDPSTRRNAFINRWNKAVLKPLDEKNGFVYIVYTNQWGQTSKGWMPKNQLKQLN